MRYIVINLSGILNTSLAESLKEHVMDILREPSAVLMDFSRVVSIEENSFLLFFSTLELIESSGSHRLAFASITPEMHKTITEKLAFDIPRFETKDVAKAFLEEKNQTKPQEKIGLHTQYSRVVDFTQKGDIYYIYCPGCSVKLRIRSIGNHACPSCKTRFLFKPEIPDHPVEATHYEMLSLD
jgi:anti-anti-sigma regulatory factor